MFETLFSYPAVLRRHQDGPLATERSDYLEGLAAQGAARGTLLRRARYCLCVARAVMRRRADHVFDDGEVEGLASAWAAKRTADGRATGPRWPEEHFRVVATDFLRAIGRLRPPPSLPPGRYEPQIEDFIAARREGPWLSEATCQSGRWQVARFVSYLEQQEVALGDVEPRHVDAYFQHVAPRWSRTSLRTSATMVRSWFSHCECRGWVRPGLAAAILLPRIYQHEGLPLGPTWDEVGQMLAKTAGDEPAHLRDHAILRLLSVYGLRSGEVRRLAIEDLDWQRERIRVVRSKSSREETLPLDPSAGNAIARYLRHGRPDATRLYAKVDLASLRRVALSDLGGLS